MKRTMTLLSVLMMGITIFAQEVVITFENHAYSPDEKNEMRLSEYVDPGQGGKNRVWDLSGMKAEKDFEGIAGPASEADTEYRFPESNIVFNEFGNKYFFNQNEGSLTSFGMTFASGRTMIHYDRPYVKMKFPFEFGDRITRDYSGTVRVSSQSYQLNGTYVVEADGFGKLILPGGSQHSQTLRIKSTQSYAIQFNQPRRVEIVTYRWYSNQERYPLAVLQTTRSTLDERTGVTQKAAFKDHTQLSSTDAPSVIGRSALMVYPNPSEDHFTVEYALENEADVLIELYDQSGKKISTLVNKRVKSGVYTHHFTAEEQSLTKGTYLIRSIIGNKTATSSFVRL